MESIVLILEEELALDLRAGDSLIVTPLPDLPDLGIWDIPYHWIHQSSYESMFFSTIQGFCLESHHPHLILVHTATLSSLVPKNA
jgi:hypothetical protein